MDTELPSNLRDLFDFILRDHYQYFRLLFAHEGALYQVFLLTVTVLLLSGFYGLIMGAPSGVRQAISSGLKLPLLFILTLLVSFPALFVITVLIGSVLSLTQMVALILFSICVGSIIMASFATISLFFSITGSRYHFMKILHVAVFAFSGLWGMGVLWAGLMRMSQTSSSFPLSGLMILLAWITVYAFVAAQMAWTLRPFIGEPSLPFELFRKRVKGMNFYSAVMLSWREMKKAREAEETGRAVETTDAVPGEQGEPSQSAD